MFETHPVGFTNPEIMRVSAALSAAGGWDATPLIVACAGAEGMVLSSTYTRGAAGGAFDFQIEYSIYAIAANAPAGANEWADMSIYAAGAVATGADTFSDLQEEFVTYGSTGAAAEAHVYGPIEFRHKIERVRVRCRESDDGIQATPGTLQVTAEFW